MEYHITPDVVSGVYKIVNLLNGRIYVGSAENLRRRYLAHCSSLARNVSASKFLQQDWNKCGKSAFIFALLEPAPIECLLATEQRWLDTHYDNQQNCYNLVSVAGNTKGRKHTKDTIEKLRAISVKALSRPFIVLDPSGVTYQDINGKKFALEHGLDAGAFNRVLSGRQLSHKGWRLPINREYNCKTEHAKRLSTTKAKTFNITLLSPDGLQIGPIHNLTAFCHEKGLPTPNIHAVVVGKVKAYKGWKLLENAAYDAKKVKMINAIKQSKTLEVNLVNPDGLLVQFITNINEFCRINNIDRSSFMRFIKGRGHVLKGWTRACDAYVIARAGQVMHPC